MPALLEEKPRTKPVRRAAGKHGSGGDGGGDGGSHDGGGAAARRQWPLVPAVLVVSLLAALLTLLGMHIGILASRAGAQLPGS